MLMNILFVLYSDFSTNSAILLAGYARELSQLGHQCVVTVPSCLETIRQHRDVAFAPLLYKDVLRDPGAIFPDGRPADVIHAWTPRENVRCFVTAYMAMCPAPLIVYLEDNEGWIARAALGCGGDDPCCVTDQEILERIPGTLSHPFYYGDFIGLADAVVLIQSSLSSDVPPWVYHETLMPGVDLTFFSPRHADAELGKQYGIEEGERVIVYPGGLNPYTRPGLVSLCEAVGLINQRGCRCRLLRTGPFALDFLNHLSHDTSLAVTDLGLLPRDKLPDLLALADVFVQPGKPDPFEDMRLPGKLPELFAMGRPMIIPDTNIAHLLKDDTNCVLTYTGSAEELADRCIDLFFNTTRAERIGRGGRRFAEERFDIKRQTKQLEEIYLKVRASFNPAMAATVWRDDGEDVHPAIRVRWKMECMANTENGLSECNTKAVLKWHGKYVESAAKRVKNLSAAVSQRDALIASLEQELSEQKERSDNFRQSLQEKDICITETHQSTGWRLTRPLHMIASIRIVLGQAGGLVNAVRRAAAIYRREGLTGLKRRVKRLEETAIDDYAEWVRRYDTLTEDVFATLRKQTEDMACKPLISVIMPVYNPNPGWLQEAIESVCGQIYTYWELCIADDASTCPDVRRILERYQSQDDRIRVVFREQNGHISAASNSALDLVSGQYVALLDHDDVLSPDALYSVALAIQKDLAVGLIYSDEDKIDREGNRLLPYFKPDWNYDLMLSQNMISHLGVYRTDLVRAVGGFRLGFEGSQDYDLALRIIEKLQPPQIVHIPRVLYHWRLHSDSTACSMEAKPYALEATGRALQEHLDRLSISGTVERHPDLPLCYVRYCTVEPLPQVTLVVVGLNGEGGFDETSLRRFIAATDYPAETGEILLVGCQPCRPDDAGQYRLPESAWAVKRAITDANGNTAAAINEAVRLAQGEIIVMMQAGLTVGEPGWLSELVNVLRQPGIGCVGARIWQTDPAHVLWHGGYILGLGGSAGHSHQFCPRHNPGYGGRAIHIQSLSAVSGACLAVWKKTFEQVGGMDEKFSTSLYDVDFCLRVKTLGLRNVWTPFAELNLPRCLPDVAVVGRNERMQYDLLFRSRWASWLEHDPAYNPNLSLEAPGGFRLAWPPRESRTNPIYQREH